MLRDGKPYTFCRFDEDERPETIHLAMIDEVDDQPKSILTTFPMPRDGFTGKGYQLRGMATHPDFQGQGLGIQLLQFLIDYLQGHGATYLWCNARKAAFPFYQRLEFKFISDEFDVPGIGPHRVMYLDLNPSPTF